jgi:PAS domain S-box-containing protein
MASHQPPASSDARPHPDSYRFALEQSNIGVWEFDPETGVVTVSPSTGPLLGFTTTPPSLTIEECLRYVHPDDERMLQSMMRTAINDGSNFSIDHRIRLPNGKVRWISSRGSVVTDADGEAIRVCGTVIDITDRTVEGERLRESEHNFRVLVENSPDVVMKVDRDRRILFINYTLPQYSVEAVLGCDVLDFIPATYHQPYQTALDTVFERSEPATLEIEAIGNTWWLVRMAPLNTAGTAEAALIIGANITQIREAQQEKARLELLLTRRQRLETLGRLAGSIAHDFNNLLSPVLGYAELAMEQEGFEVRDSLQQIRDAATRAAGLVNQILVFSRQDEPVVERVDLQPVIEEAVRLCQSVLPPTITCSVDIIPGVGAVMADSTQIHQVVVSLRRKTLDVDQAEAIGAPGAGDYARLAVEDTGGGMSEKLIERIFEPFFTTRKSGEGTGLGLAVVFGIVTRLGGTIDVKSVPGRGTVMYIYLPSAGGEAEVAEEPPPPMPKAGGHILVVDDQDVNAQVTRRLLEALGYTCETARSGERALALFSTAPERFDLVLTDQTMGAMSGDELGRRVRDLRADIPVVLTTGYSETIGPREAAAMRFGYLEKPARMDALSSVVAEAMMGGADGAAP